MKKLLSIVFLAGLITAVSSNAYAGSCPLEMKKIDAAVSAQSGLSAAQMVKVAELRSEGEALHNSGSHSASIKALKKAMAVLGM